MLRYGMAAWVMLCLASPVMAQDEGGYSFTLSRPPEVVATAVGVAYTNLGLPISGTQADGRVLVALNVPINRQIFHHPEEQFFDCGQSPNGLRMVGSTDHRLSVLTKIYVMNGQTVVRVWTTLTKKDVSMRPETTNGQVHARPGRCDRRDGAEPTVGTRRLHVERTVGKAGRAGHHGRHEQLTLAVRCRCRPPIGGGTSVRRSRGVLCARTPR